MNKSELRKKYKSKRGILTTADKNSFSKRIFYQIIEKFNFSDKTVHLFIPIEKLNEVDTVSFRNSLFDFNYKVATSITLFNPLCLTHCIISKNTQYEDDKFGIPTPINAKPIKEQDIDIVIVPLLAFDKNGGRVGYGKGLYDRFLSKCRKDCLKIGVSFFSEEETIEDVDSNDVSLDFCVTPDRIYTFN